MDDFLIRHSSTTFVPKFFFFTFLLQWNFKSWKICIQFVYYCIHWTHWPVINGLLQFIILFYRFFCQLLCLLLLSLSENWFSVAIEHRRCCWPSIVCASENFDSLCVITCMFSHKITYTVSELMPKTGALFAFENRAIVYKHTHRLNMNSNHIRMDSLSDSFFTAVYWWSEQAK